MKWSSLSPIEDAELQLFAQQAYRYCIDWFGVPLDDNWRYVLVDGSFDGCAHNRILREYTIVIRSDYAYPEQKKAAIAHEMYHRMTLLKEGLRESAWIDEMLAFLVSQRILSNQGMLEYANLRLQRQLNSKYRLDLSSLQKAQRKRILFGLGGITYPQGFASAVACLGTELEAKLGWSTINYLVQCRTWEEWFAKLPPESKSDASALLGIDLCTMEKYI